MKDRIVYSTNANFISDSDNEENVQIIANNEQNLRIWLEKRPGNKVVSIIKNFKGTTDDLRHLEKEIKKQCGVGGSTKGEDIIIQTKDRQKLLQILNKMGYFAKLSGG